MVLVGVGLLVDASRMSPAAQLAAGAWLLPLVGCAHLPRGLRVIHGQEVRGVLMLDAGGCLRFQAFDDLGCGVACGA